MRQGQHFFCTSKPSGHLGERLSARPWRQVFGQPADHLKAPDARLQVVRLRACRRPCPARDARALDLDRPLLPARASPPDHRATWAKGFLRVLGGKSSVNPPIISKHPALGFK
jgi:hypothetical protein